MMLQDLFREHMTPFRLIILGFMTVILIGMCLLALPVSSASGVRTPLIDALFTSASAVCVTGLVVHDTATYWSLFGRIVILILIQIGGLGVITAVIGIQSLTGKQIGIFQRSTMQNAVSAMQIGGIVRFTVFILKGTLLAELIGAAVLFPVFAGRYGVLQGLGYAVFHAVSAFCNAGFDLMGIHGQYSSLMTYAENVTVNMTVILLIILRGLGFLTWEDLFHNRFRLKRTRLQTKIILTVTAFLLTVPFLYFYFFEFQGYTGRQRILYSFFQTVTPRTAGFNTYDQAMLTENGLLVTILLMLTGGAPGSTAGGMKVTTVFILIAASYTRMRRAPEVSCFGRRLEDSAIRDALTLIMIWTILLLCGSMFLSMYEHVHLLNAFFECASALGTVGLSTGITPGLSGLSKIMLTGFMFFGRVGGLTLAYAAASPGRTVNHRYPAEKVIAG